MKRLPRSTRASCLSEAHKMDDEVQVLMELDDTNLQFLPEESVPCERLVFKIVNALGDDSTALANMAVMFRGEDLDMIKILGCHIAVKDNAEYKRVGTGIPDEDDVRVMRITEWTSSVPLPLGNDLLERLRIVVIIDEHTMPTKVKFGADLVPFPEVFLEGNPRMKRRLGSSTIRFQGGKLVDIENAMSALTLGDGTSAPATSDKPPAASETASLHVRLVPQDPVPRPANPPVPPVRQDFWWKVTGIPFKIVKRLEA